MSEETAQQEDPRVIHLKDDEAAIVFTNEGNLRLYRRTVPSDYDHILAAAMTMLTAEGERVEKAIDLIFNEMEEQMKTAIGVKEVFEKILEETKKKLQG